MAGLKTQPTSESVDRFLATSCGVERIGDCRKLLELMRSATGAKPVMWGDSIVGFGRYEYRYASGREGSWFLVGFSPRKRDLTLYIMSGFDGYDELLGRLGRYRTGKSCLYIKRLDEIDLQVLEQLVSTSVAHMRVRSTS